MCPRIGRPGQPGHRKKGNVILLISLCQVDGAEIEDGKRHGAVRQQYVHDVMNDDEDGLCNESDSVR